MVWRGHQSDSRWIRRNRGEAAGNRAFLTALRRLFASEERRERQRIAVLVRVVYRSIETLSFAITPSDQHGFDSRPPVGRESSAHDHRAARIVESRACS